MNKLSISMLAIAGLAFCFGTVRAADPVSVTALATASDAVTAVASGGVPPYSYILNPDGGVSDSGIFRGLRQGSYTVIATDSTGIASDPVAVDLQQLQQAGFVITSATGTNVTCPGGDNGTVTIIASPCYYSYTYTPSTVTYTITNSSGVATSNSTGVFTGLTADTYATSATCLGTTVTGPSVTITEPATITFTATITEEAICNTVPPTLGTITVTDVAGGTPPYTYSSNNGTNFQDSDEFTDLAVGTYEIVVQDANNCMSAAESVDITGTRALVGNPIEDYITTKYCKGSCTTPANE